MNSLKQSLNRRLSLQETAMVLVAVVILAGLGYAAYEFIAAKMLGVRGQKAVPKPRLETRTQRQTIIAAIEAYKTHFGFYPPDHVVSRQPLAVDAATNWLVYELVGVTYNSTNHWFQMGKTEQADAKFVQDFFHCDGFTNS